MQIHATNIHGLGASQVVISFLESFGKMEAINRTTIYLPDNGVLSEYTSQKGVIKKFKRKLPNGVSRLFECMFSRFFFSNEPTIVLGDIPLRGIKNQVVLVHQPNLIYPSVNSFSGKSLTFKISRFLFRINQHYAKKIIVQTGAMAEDMIKSYPKIKDKVFVLPQPVPNWLKRDKVNSRRKGKIILFYPAAFYPHKKHEFLLDVNFYCNESGVKLSDIEIWLTLSEEEFEPYKEIKFLKNLGRLNSKEMNLFYQKADALLFLSSMESYGLPLIEALTINLPIIAVDFNYSKWMCEEQAYYFEPYCEASFVNILNVFKEDFKKGKCPDYSSVLTKFPKSWDFVTSNFQNALIQ